MNRIPPRRTCLCPCHDLGDELLSGVMKDFQCKPGQECCEYHDQAWPEHSNTPIPWLTVNDKKLRLVAHSGYSFSVLRIEIRKNFGRIGRFTDELLSHYEIQTTEPDAVMQFIEEFCQKENIPVQEMPEAA
jgi:hypothetical protein